MRRVLIASLALIVATPFGAIAPARSSESDASADGSTRTLYLVLIRQAREDGKARAALAYLDDFDRRHPGDREAQVLRVNCLLDLGQLEGAEQALARIPQSERGGEVLAVRGHVLAAQKRWVDAVTAYAAAQSASPADPFIGNAYGYAQLRAGQPAQAVETLKRALDLAPDQAHGQALVRNNLALALTAASRSGEAQALLARVRDSGERTRLSARLQAEATRLAALGGDSAPQVP